MIIISPDNENAPAPTDIVTKATVHIGSFKNVTIIKADPCTKNEPNVKNFRTCVIVRYSLILRKSAM